MEAIDRGQQNRRNDLLDAIAQWNNDKPFIRRVVGGPNFIDLGTYRGLLNLPFDNYFAIELTVSNDITLATSLFPRAGSMACLILNFTGSFTAGLGVGFKKLTGSAGIVGTIGQIYTVFFISDGEYLLEISRAGPLTP